MGIDRPTAMICTHCESGDSFVSLVVYSKARHEFQFMCGAEGHEIADAYPIHADHVFNDDPTLIPLAYIGTSFIAERSIRGNHWRIEFVAEAELSNDDLAT